MVKVKKPEYLTWYCN